MVLIQSAFRPLPIPKPITRCLPPMDVRDIILNVRDNKASISSPCRYLPDVLRDALCDMAVVHSSLCNVCKVKGRVSITRGTPCPKWHVDRVRMRGICSLIGPGTVVKEHNETLHLCTGDAIFMRGAGMGEKWEQAVLHRSPHIGEHDVRLVVQTDCWEEKDSMVVNLGESA
ncbi:hypothetical protein FGB62_11g120 [Gracilaria domingensis]|nr:hypothetical protein FGB62_11g120 [Gracilaria domingensis]